MCVQRRLRSTCASAQSHQSLRRPPEDASDSWLPTECLAKTLIRLRGCVGDLSIRRAHVESPCYVPAHLSLVIYMLEDDTTETSVQYDMYNLSVLFLCKITLLQLQQ